MDYLYKLVTTENVELNYDAFKKKELVDCLATMRSIYFSLKQENQQLKLINEEYERLNKENGRGFKITSVQKYDIYELLKYKDNWNKLKEIIKRKFVAQGGFTSYEWNDLLNELLDKIVELERGVRMNIELTDLDMILNYLETTSLESHDDYTSEITYKDQKILYKYIKDLQQQNQQLRIEISAREEEYRKLEDNWNKLKNWLEKELGDRTNPRKDKWLTGVYDSYRETIDKMKELERGVSDVED